MAIVAIVALDLGAIRVMSDVQNTSRATLGRAKDPAEFDRIVNRRTRAELLALGALPMANILAVGLLGRTRRRSRPFLMGFETFGAAALAFYITGVSYFTYEELRPYTDLLVDPFRKSFGPSPPVVYVVVGLSIFGVILALPQIAFALIGGLLLRRLRTTE